MYNQKPQPPRTFGGVQNTFRYNFRNLSQINEQFTIVEDLPRNKPIRVAYKEKKDKSNTYPVLLIKISNNNFEADLEMMDHEFDQLAIACPKDAQNMKGITFAFDGRRWQYVCGEMPVPRDPRQPDLNPPPQPQDQSTTFLQKMIGSMRALESVNVPIDVAKLMQMCESISPGNALELIASAKSQGLIVEDQGKYKVID